MHKWFLHEGSSEEGKDKSFKFSTTSATSWTSTNKMHAKISKWRKSFEKKLFFHCFLQQQKIVKNKIFTWLRSRTQLRMWEICSKNLYRIGSVVSKNSSAQGLFEELCLPDIFVYKNCAKSMKKIVFIYSKSLFIKPNKFYINIYFSNL